uniref:Gt2 n=1 Tax=Proteus vulgaris TaxID=585 RepID=A0A385JNA8_PROVU|nr:gt2 [Proteus vulgaris]
MNIIYICHEYPPFKTGGIGIYTKEIAENLSNKGHGVYVIGIYDQENKSIEKINNVNIIRLPSSKNKILKKVINRCKLYVFLKIFIKKTKIDIIETPDFQGWLAFFPKLKCKYLIRLHGSVTYFYELLKIKSYKKLIWKYIEKNALKKADKIISVSNFTAQETKKIFNIKNSIDVIHNGIEINNKYIEKHPQNNMKKFVFAGSLIKKKGIIELVDAWKIFSENKIDVELHIFGKDTEGLLSLFLIDESLKIGDNLFFHGAVEKNKLIEFYKSAHFFISPSKAEAFSLAPMEAMASSLLVIYNNQTSATELITHNENGYLLSNLNNLNIAKTLEIVYALTDHEYNSITKASYLTVKDKFNVENLTNKNTSMYINLIK